MSDLQRLHCRHCKQTFHTVPNAERCDLCGKSGGMVRAEIAEVEERQEAIQQAERERERAKKQELTPRRFAQGMFTVVIFVSCLHSVMNPAEVWSYTWFFDKGALVVGALGALACWLWPKKPDTSGKGEGQGEDKPG